MVKTVVIGKQAQKQLRKVPSRIRDALLAWAYQVQGSSLEEVRKIPGYHDEPLSGDRQGQRSIRLSRQWRAIYVLTEDGGIELAEVIEVTAHKY
jgi:proteic killer suppression protein